MINKRLPITFVIMIAAANLFAQHNGDSLSFQGYPAEFTMGVKALAMGGAYTANTGDLNSLFYNPAGLADVNELQLTIGMNSYQKLWRENQTFRPNRLYWTMAFYLEGLYVPDPANNGVWDYEFARDSSFVVQDPQTGKDSYGEDAADWQKTRNNLGFNYAAAAFPFEVMNYKLVVSAAYQRNDLYDYDRNDTYLSPHIGIDKYGILPRSATDTLTFNWYRFERSRFGDMTTYTGALAMDVTEEIKLGVGLTIISGESDDQQSLNRMGFFDIANNNRLRFTYDTLNTHISGKSEYMATKFNVGGIYKFERLSLGFNIFLPYTLERKWNYNIDMATADSSWRNKTSGTDRFEIPATFSFGATLSPIDQFTAAVDYQFTNFSQGKIDLSTQNAKMNADWPNQQILCFGAEYRPYEFLSLLAGYREISAVFIPDGAAIKDRGPSAQNYSIGASVKLWQFGRIDMAYEYKQLKYYDSYFSNTNYVYEGFNNFSLAYTYTF